MLFITEVTSPEQLNPNPSYSCINEGTPISSNETPRSFDIHMSNWCCVFRQPFLTQSMNAEFQMPFCYSNLYFDLHQIEEEEDKVNIETLLSACFETPKRQHAEVPKEEENDVVSEYKENKFVFTNSWK